MEFISVLMCVYNTPEKYLREAIESILDQTYTNFEFVIVDDFCDVKTRAVLMSYEDYRIKVYRNSCNLGLTKSLNIGLSLCSGRYVARMDSDDVADKKRLEKQLSYIKDNKYYIIGSRYEFLPSKKFNYFFSEDYETQRIRMIFGNSGIVHSTAFFDKNKFDELEIKYNEEYLKSQDYAMWCECLNKGLTLGLCPEKLLKWRESESQISRVFSDEQAKCKNEIRKNYIIDNYCVEGIDIDEFIAEVSLQSFLNNTGRVESELRLFLILNNKNSFFEKEILRFWLMQVFYRIKYKRRFDFVFKLLTIKCFKPSNLSYIIRSLK